MFITNKNAFRFLCDANFCLFWCPRFQLRFSIWTAAAKPCALSFSTELSSIFMKFCLTRSHRVHTFTRMHAYTHTVARWDLPHICRRTMQTHTHTLTAHTLGSAKINGHRSRSSNNGTHTHSTDTNSAAHIIGDDTILLFILYISVSACSTCMWIIFTHGIRSHIHTHSAIHEQ